MPSLRLSRGTCRWLGRGGEVLLGVVGITVVCLAAIWLSVTVTPLQSVSAAGQTVEVGAVQPRLDWSGQGELDLFGQRLPTRPSFEGPIRPRLRLADISIDSQVNQIVRSGGHDTLELTLSRQLAAGWTRYCVWETVIAAGFAAVFAVAVAGVRCASPRRMIVMVAGAVAAVTAVNAVGVYLLASGTPRVLQQVHTLDDLVGRVPPQPVSAAKGPTLSGVRAVVLGDSTAAGIGNRLVDNPTPLDRACGRSADSFAAELAAANNWNVLNLACQGATVNDGILGVQIRGTQPVPPQLAVAQRARDASVIIVSIGANDMNWAALTALCAAAPVCDDKASTAYYDKQLATFTKNYLDLLQQLSNLPNHPDVLVNEYYDPFGPRTDCLRKDGLTAAKTAVLDSRLADLNTVLERGAATFRFTTAKPDFSGHELCSQQPFVQNSADQAPLHPTAAGELAIALADEHGLAELERQKQTATPAPSPTASSPSAPSPAAFGSGTAGALPRASR